MGLEDYYFVVFCRNFRYNGNIRNVVSVSGSINFDRVKMGYDIDIEPQPFTIDEYHETIGIVSEIVKIGIELAFPA